MSSSRRRARLLDLAPALAEAAGLSLDQPRQERQVRRTAQRLLAQHLRPEPDKHGRPTNPAFWDGSDGTGLDLDLASATLHDWDFRYCCVRRADFAGAAFHGDTEFSGVQFHGKAGFSGVQFHGVAWFLSTQFHGSSGFHTAWARLDHDSDVDSPWPAGWTVYEDEPGDGRASRWGKFVLADEEPSGDQESDTTPEVAGEWAWAPCRRQTK